MQIPARNQTKQQSTLQDTVKFFYFLLSFCKHTEPLLIRKNMMGKKTQWREPPKRTDYQKLCINSSGLDLCV